MAIKTPLKVAVCEDLQSDAELLKTLVKQSGIDVCCAAFESAEDLLNSFAGGRYDLIFMDIYMRGMNGVEAVKAIREVDENVTIAFATSSLDHTLESYRLKALRYLEKPLLAADVKETLEFALLRRDTRPCVSLLIGGKHLDIPIDDIIFFEHRNHAVEVHTEAGVLKTSQSVRLDDIETRLPSPPFYRCLKSFLVNLSYVRKIDEELRTFVMKNGEQAYIRQNLMKKMKNAYEDYLYAAARVKTQ